MKFARIVIGVASLCVWGACKDIPQAPPEVVPTVSPYTTILIDVDPYNDYSAPQYPSLIVSGPTTFGLVYGLVDMGKIRFAGCPNGCDQRNYWVVGTPDSNTVIGRFVSAVLAHERLEIAYQAKSSIGSNPGLRFATCPGLCQRSTGWSVTDIDTVAYTGNFVSMAAAAGTTHIAYVTIEAQLRYTVCAGGCENPSAWHATTVDSVGSTFETQVGVDGSGTVHIVYVASDQSGGEHLKHARCSAACDISTNWQTSTIGPGSLPSLTVDASGELHLAYVDSTGHGIRVAHCPTGCAGGTAWQASSIVVGANDGPRVWDVALIAQHAGKLHLAYSASRFDSVHYDVIRLGSCTSSCLTSQSWSFGTIDSARFNTTTFVALAADSVGHIGVARARTAALRFTLVKEDQ